MAPSSASVRKATPASSRTRRRTMSRKWSETKATTSRLRSIAGMYSHRNTATRRCSASAVACLVLHHGDADIVRARIGAVGLLAREIAAGHDAHAGLAHSRFGHGFAAAVARNVEPEEEAAGRPLVAVAVADDLVGEIEFRGVEPAVVLDMRLVAIGRDRDLLQRHRHLRRGDVAQLEDRRRGSGGRRRRSRRAGPAGSSASTANGRRRRWRSRACRLPACRSARARCRSPSSIRRRTSESRSGARGREPLEIVAARRPRPADSTARRGRRRPCARAAPRRARRDRAGSRSRASPADRPARSRRRRRRPHRPHRTDWGSASRVLPARGLTQRVAAMAARNRPSRVPLSTSTSLSGSTGARQLVAAAEPCGDGVAERFDALVGRVAAEVSRDARRAPGRRRIGIGCCGSPTERLMAGLPGSMSAISSVSRTNGERLSTAGAGTLEFRARGHWLRITGGPATLRRIQSAGRRPQPRASPSRIEGGEVKTRLTNGIGGRPCAPDSRAPKRERPRLLRTEGLDGRDSAGFPPLPLACERYCTASPCSARSRPSRSTSAVTRRPMMASMILRMISETMAS